MDVRLSLLGRSNAEQRIAYLMLETFDRLRQRGVTILFICVLAVVIFKYFLGLNISVWPTWTS